MNDESSVPSALAALAESVGITIAYWDAGGTYRRVPAATLEALLVALHVLEAGDTGTDAIEAARERERLAPWRRVLPPVQVLYENEAASTVLTVADERLDVPCLWSIRTEAGALIEGELTPNSLSPCLDVSGERAELDGRLLRRLVLPLPELPIGYHTLTVSGADDVGETERAPLIVAPRTCHGANAQGGADTDERVWGLALQLYAVRSARNWGIGDFTDLARACEEAGSLGADVIGINPLHALFAHEPESASPYSPSSRLFLNPLYIDIYAVVEQDAAGAGDDLGAGGDRDASSDSAPDCDPEALPGLPDESDLRKLREGEFVDYGAVAELKRRAFEPLWSRFVSRHRERDTQRARAFDAFREREGEPLARFALFEALRESLHERGEVAGDWRQWPESLRSPGSPAVLAFAEKQAERIDFHAWLQWLAAEQLDEVAVRAEAAGLSVGLYRDLAVGISSGGSDGWADQAHFASGIHVGAPPDDFSANGQDWGLPPFDPRALAQAGYAPFANILRANMRASGAIRIDHVMGLARLFWIPAGGSPTEGAYLDYPLADLLAVVALESRRAGCLVIGEDLGTVPEGFRETLAAAGVLSYKLMYFEKHYEGDQSFRLPEQYSPQSLVGADTHDLPTVRGFWAGVDLAVRESLDLFPEPDMHRAQQSARGEDRGRLLHALARAGALPDGIDPNRPDEVIMDETLVQAVHRFLAMTRSRLLIANVEDLLGQIEQMNLPGTDRDLYPNWRRKLPMALEHWSEHAPLVACARAMSEERVKAD